MAKLNQQKLELFTYIWVEGLNGKNLWRWVGLVRGRRMDWNWRARLSYVLCYWPRLSQSFLNQPPGGGVYPYYVRGGGGEIGKNKNYWSKNLTGGLLDMTKSRLTEVVSVFVPQNLRIYHCKILFQQKNICWFLAYYWTFLNVQRLLLLLIRQFYKLHKRKCDHMYQRYWWVVTFIIVTQRNRSFDSNAWCVRTKFVNLF